MSVKAVFKIGQTVGAYRILRQLGKGGMGRVYEVEHIQLGVHYAMKAFSSSSERTAMLRKKFLEEGQILARLNHPNIVRVTDLAIDRETGTPYFVMDLVHYSDGECYTISDVKREDMTEDHIFTWFKDICSALEYIHGQGIVHRDIKPGNLLLKSDLHVVLTDLGIARIFGSKLKEDLKPSETMVTKSWNGKIVLGTKHFVAPEVIGGKEATPAADAYALGVMTFHWLTNFWYEPGADASSILGRNYKYRWKTVLPRLLATDPADRPTISARLADMLRPVHAQTPKTAGPVLKRKPAAGKRRRDIGIVSVAAGLVAAALLGCISYFVFSDRTGRNASVSEKKAVTYPLDGNATAENAPVKRHKIPPAAETFKRLPESEKTSETHLIPDYGKKKPVPPNTGIPEPGIPSVREPGKADSGKTNRSPDSDDKKLPGKCDPADVRIPKNRWPSPESADIRHSRPQEFKLRLVERNEMVFCAIPSGKFRMRNPEGQRDDYHNVELTYPYWMSKYCVTVGQWREFAKDGPHEETGAELERLFRKFPVYRAFPRGKWLEYCEFMNRRYGSQLPDGYVFRLPTEAEYEWAFSGNAGGDLSRLDCREFNPETEKYRKRFLSMCRKGIPHGLTLEEKGIGQFSGIWFVGGRTKPTGFGVCDMMIPGFRDILTLDTYDITCLSDKNGNILKIHSQRELRKMRQLMQHAVIYEENETDPFHCAGRLASCGIRRFGAYRLLTTHLSNAGTDACSYAHLVAGPDVMAKWNERNPEDRPYPKKDFGGSLLSENAKFDGMSSKFKFLNVTPLKWRSVFSTDPVLVQSFDQGKDTRYIHTEKESSPWIQFKLDSARKITGMLIDVFKNEEFVCPLKIWASEDGKNWIEIHEDPCGKHRYRIDLRGKNVTAKHIRLGRTPGIRKEFFALNKILVYGK